MARCGTPTSCHGGLHTGQNRFAKPSSSTGVGQHRREPAGHRGPHEAAPTTGTGSRTLYDVCLPNISRAVKVGIFPTTEISGGHTFFVQNYHTSTGRWPRAVHATYQVAG